jgi:two-component system OmpR family response regulator
VSKLSDESAGVGDSGLSPELRNAPVLIVEDDPALAEGMRHRLEGSGHLVKLASTIEEGLELAQLRWAWALIIDRMLQGRDGLSIVEALRGEGDLTPVLVISALSSVDDRIKGLIAGGDDYLVKPFDLRELAVRVDALLRRRGEPRATRLKAGDIEMDLVERKVRCGGRAVDLLPREFKLLEYFMRRPGLIVTRAMLLEHVWDFKFYAETHVVDVQIGNLRRKLDAASERRHIVNVRAVGFKLNVDD